MLSIIPELYQVSGAKKSLKWNSGGGDGMLGYIQPV